MHALHTSTLKQFPHSFSIARILPSNLLRLSPVNPSYLAWQYSRVIWGGAGVATVSQNVGISNSRLDGKCSSWFLFPPCPDQVFTSSVRHKTARNEWFNIKTLLILLRRRALVLFSNVLWVWQCYGRYACQAFTSMQVRTCRCTSMSMHLPHAENGLVHLR